MKARIMRRAAVFAVLIASGVLLREACGDEFAVGPVPQLNIRKDELEIPTGDLFGVERLFIRFRGYPDLTGEYRISSDLMVSIPVVGRITVSGIDASALERVLASKMTEIARREVFVTVEILAYRPVFVTGYVKNPGVVQWQPGLTVLQAVALAGGLYRAESGGGLNSGDTDVTRYRKAVEDLKRNLAVLERLRAEQKGSPKLEPNRRLIEIVGTVEAERLLEAQRAIMVSRLGSFETQVKSIERARALAAQELDGLRAQRARIAEQLELRRKQAQKTRELETRGIVTSSRLLEDEVRVSDLEEKVSGIGVGVARVETVLSSLQREASSAKMDRDAALHSEIARYERDVAQLELEVAASTGSPADVQATGRGGVPSLIRYEVVNRERVGEAAAAVQSTLLKPADVLVISPTLR